MNSSHPPHDSRSGDPGQDDWHYEPTLEAQRAENVASGSGSAARSSGESSAAHEAPLDAHSSTPTASRHPDDGPRRAASRLVDPFLNPRFARSETRTKRAWWLLGATLVAPGSAQLATGREQRGRLILKVTISMWILAVLGAVLWLVWKTALVWLLTNSLTSAVFMWALVALAAGWAYVWFDTMRIIRPGLLKSGMRNAVVLATVVGMLVTSGGLLYGAHLVSVARGSLSNIFPGGLPFAPSHGRYNILLMGGDAGEGREGRRPDSMSVLSVDARTGQAVSISLPRNLQNVPFPDDSPLKAVYPEGFNCGDECLLNALYMDVTKNHQDLYPKAKDPGAQATKEAAEGITGLRVHGYAMLDMDGFESLVDAVGGITVDVGGRVIMGGGTNSITGQPNRVRGYIEPGVQTLDGYHALWYARSRVGASDYDRQARQRCVQAAMLKQLDPLTILTKFDELASSGEKLLETDIPRASLGSLVNAGLKAKNHDLVPYAAGPPYYDQSFPTYPDYQQFQQDLEELLKNGGKAHASGTNITQGGAAASSDVQRSAPGAAVTGVTGVGIGTAVVHPAAFVTITQAEELSANGTCSVP